MMLQPTSRVALSRVWMCDGGEAEEAPAEAPADEKSILDDLSGVPAEMLEKIKGMSLLDISALSKQVEETFNLGPKDEEEGESDE